MIGFLMGTCIAFFVVMGDLAPPVVAKITGVASTANLRLVILIGTISKTSFESSKDKCILRFSLRDFCYVSTVLIAQCGQFEWSLYRLHWILLLRFVSHRDRILAQSHARFLDASSQPLATCGDLSMSAYILHSSLMSTVSHSRVFWASFFGLSTIAKAYNR